MITRHLPRTLHRLHPPPSTSTSCLTCTCRCGVTFNPPSNHHNPPQQSHRHQQRRHYARRAPSTIDAEIARESIPLTPAQAAEHRNRKNFHNQWFSRQLQFLHMTGTLSCTPETAMDFLSDYDRALQASSSSARHTVEPKLMLALLAKYRFHFSVAEALGRVLLRDDIPANLHRGKTLLYSLSRAGYAESTIRVMAHAVLEAKRRPAVLKSREIAYSREHLTKVAQSEEGNYRAMVLEGKIALTLGKEEYAIEMFTKAMDAAVEASEWALSRPSVGKKMVEGDPLELTAPWHELMQVHWYRSTVKGLDETALCEWAMEIGCQQDDPLAHKFKADFIKRWESAEMGEEGVHIGTSEWLYHITKAASSGVPQAAHELAVFYAESGWKYIEDEPPEHVKPTPFDSYPAGQTATTFWNVLHFLGLKDKKFTPQERTFHNAVFPHTAVDRLKIAMSWLEQAMSYNYAPSFLLMAQLYNRKTLWSQADAPSSALKLQDERYTYANKKDFLANKPIPREPEEEKSDPPNPLYDPTKAKTYLIEIFSAYEASRYESRMKKYYDQSRYTPGRLDKLADPDEALDTRFMMRNGGLPPKLAKWFRFPEVRELNSERVRGLWEVAKGICEEEGWVLVDEEGGLVYKSGLGERRL